MRVPYPLRLWQRVGSSVPLIRFGLACNPLNPQPLISHLTNSNRCGSLQFKVLPTVSPFRPSFLPPVSVFSQQHLALLPNLHAALANSTLSVACRLLVPLASLFRARSLCFHQLADSFVKIPGVWVSRRILRGTRGRGTSATTPRSLRLPVRQAGLGIIIRRRFCPAPFDSPSALVYLPLESTLAKVYQNK